MSLRSQTSARATLIGVLALALLSINAPSQHADVFTRRPDPPRASPQARRRRLPLGALRGSA
jgi:hypothetical protein